MVCKWTVVPWPRRPWTSRRWGWRRNPGGSISVLGPHTRDTLWHYAPTSGEVV